MTTNKDLIPLMTEIKSKENVKIGMDFSYFQENKSVLPIPDEIPTVTEPEDIKKKTTRKRKSTSNINTENTGHGNIDGDLDMLQSNESYAKTYDETNNMLKGTIAQIETSMNAMQVDVQQIRSSRTLKRKYDYLSMMQNTMGQYIGNKVSAIRELNSSITKSNELDLKRMKELKLSQSKENDDKTIMDMYNAYISTPVSAGLQLGPTLQELSVQNSGLGMGASNIQAANSGYDAYMNNLNSAQILMMYEDDPDVQQVVMYEESTGACWFEVMNTRTNEIIKGADKHDPMFIEDTTLDLNNGIARNINLGETYPIVMVGSSVVDTY